MTVPVSILASMIAASAAILIAFVGALFNINSRLGKVEAEVRASRDHFETQLAAAEERALARHAVAMEGLATAEERALARHAVAMEGLATAEERALVRHAVAMEGLAAVEERALAREAAAEERALARHAATMASLAASEERAVARHNELLSEIRLWRTHWHDADGTIFFRVPEQ